MGKFRKKPIIIEARQWLGDWGQSRELIEWCGGTEAEFTGWKAFYIDTPKGYLHPQAGDWIIKGAEDEFYLCHPDIFEQTYEAVQDIKPSEIVYKELREDVIHKQWQEAEDKLEEAQSNLETALEWLALVIDHIPDHANYKRIGITAFFGHCDKEQS